MKWLQTAAALLVLAWSASARADLFGRYQASPAEGENVGGAEITPPDTNDSSFHETATITIDESGAQNASPADPASMGYASRVNSTNPYAAQASSQYSTQASNQYSTAPVPTTVPGGPRGTYPYPAGGSFAAAATCCQPMAPGAVGLWDDYCSTRQSGKGGWLGGWMFARNQCGCSMQQGVCGQPACAGCGYNYNSCGCRKSMMFSGKYGCGYGAAACGACGSSQTWGGQTWDGATPDGSYDSSPSDQPEPVTPTPPSPVPDAEILQSNPQAEDLQTAVPQEDTPADTAESDATSSDAPSAPAKKPARTGLFSNGFRLFPGLLGR